MKKGLRRGQVGKACAGCETQTDLMKKGLRRGQLLYLDSGTETQTDLMKKGLRLAGEHISRNLQKHRQT